MERAAATGLLGAATVFATAGFDAKPSAAVMARSAGMAGRKKLATELHAVEARSQEAAAGSEAHDFAAPETIDC